MATLTTIEFEYVIRGYHEIGMNTSAFGVQRLKVEVEISRRTRCLESHTSRVRNLS